MSRTLLIFLVSLLSLGLSKKNTSEKDMLKQDNKTTRIVSVFFPTDDGRWIDRIVSSFTANVQKSNMDVTFFTASYNRGQSVNSLVESLKTLNPDIVFLPDDLLYKDLSKPIAQAIPKSTIVFTSFYTDLKDTQLLPPGKQFGVAATAPIEVLIKQSEKLIVKPIKSIGLVGGPLAPEIISHITHRASEIGVKIEQRMCKTWDDYTQAVSEMEKKHDAVWPLAPFLVKMKDGSDVNMHQFAQTIERINKPSFGYGAIKTNPLISMNVKPELLGENAAALVVQSLTGEKPGVEKFRRFSLVISTKAVKKMNLKIPQDLIGFLGSN